MQASEVLSWAHSQCSLPELLNFLLPLLVPAIVRLHIVCSIILVRNIGNEPKREPLKLARIEKIHESRDNAQRVVTLTYNNVRVNKDGEWIGTPIQVERSINDLVLVDNALSDSMLNPRISKVKDNNRDEQGNEVKVDDDKKLEKGEKENENDAENHEIQEVNETNDEMDGNEVTNEEIKVRKSSRIRK